MSVDERVLEMLSNFIKQNREKLFSMKPDEVVDKIMESIKKYGLSAKFYLRMNWSKIENAFKNQEQLLEALKQYDNEVFTIVINNIDWFREFLNKLYSELRSFTGK